MHEASNTKTPIRLAPAVFWASIAGAVIIGWAAGLAPEYLGGFGRFILYSMLFVCLVALIYGIVAVISEPSASEIPSASETKSYVLSPEELGRWRSIKPGMERHEVTAILGQPDGPPVKSSLGRPLIAERVVVYAWGRGQVVFRANGGPVVEVEIPEYI